MRELVGDDRLGFLVGFSRFGIEQDHRANHTPTDWRRKLIAGEEGRSVFEAHPLLRAG